MSRFSSSAAALASLAQIAGIFFALGSLLVVAPRQAAFMPSYALMSQSAFPERGLAVADSGLSRCPTMNRLGLHLPELPER